MYEIMIEQVTQNNLDLPRLQEYLMGLGFTPEPTDMPELVLLEHAEWKERNSGLPLRRLFPRTFLITGAVPMLKNVLEALLDRGQKLPSTTNFLLGVLLADKALVDGILEREAQLRPMSVPCLPVAVWSANTARVGAE